MISINQTALKLIEPLWNAPEQYYCKKKTLQNGTRLVDCGIEVPGSYEAGKIFSEATTGGMARVEFGLWRDGPVWYPGLHVTVQEPAVGCMAAQYAGWAVKVEKFFAMGSGPARALYRGEELFKKIPYTDSARAAVLTMEGRQMPDEKVTDYIAKKCGIGPDALTILIAPTSSIVGSIQISARIVETCLHKMLEVGFDIGKILHGYGSVPVAPLCSDDLKGIGRTNDCILYGGRVFLTVKCEDQEISDVIEKIPSRSSKDYGRSFYELFMEYKDFYKIDPHLFSPAEVQVNNVKSGNTFKAGGLNPAVIVKSFSS